MCYSPRACTNTGCSRESKRAAPTIVGQVPLKTTHFGGFSHFWSPHMEGDGFA